MPEIERIHEWPPSHRCTNGGGRTCPRKARYLIRRAYRWRGWEVKDMRYACITHARTFAKRHGLTVPGDNKKRARDADD